MLRSTLDLYKNSYGGLSRSTWLLSLVMLINRSGTMVLPFMTIYLTQALGVGIGKAGFVMSLFGCGAIAGALIGGRVTDKIGFYYVQVGTLLGGGAMFIMLGKMQSYPAICITTFILSFINEAFRPANAVAMAHYSTDENRVRSFSLNRLSINLGWAIGSAIGGIIASYRYELLFWVDGLTNIAAAILLLFILSPVKNKIAITRTTAPIVNTRSAYKDSNYLFFISIQVLFAVCFFQLFTTLPVFYKIQLHLSEAFIGFNMAINGLLIALFEMIIVFKLEGRRPIIHYMAAGVFLVGIAYLVLNLPIASTMLLALLSMLFITLGEMIAMPFMNAYWISRTNTENRGQYAALYTVAWSIAQAIGPFFGSQVAEHFGYNNLWFTIGAMCICLTLAYWVLYRKEMMVVSTNHPV